jgi:hypothetical protein
MSVNAYVVKVLAVRGEAFRLYIRRRSMGLDLRLILLSFVITVRGSWERRGRKR